MISNLSQLEINVNLFTLTPGFVNSELHYMIAGSETDFRFCNWSDQPSANESKFYCFLQKQEYFIPAGSIRLNQHYRLTSDPAFPVLKNGDDFISFINNLPDNASTKAIREFYDEQIGSIVDELRTRFAEVEKHVVQSDEASHLLILIKNIEISVSSTMVYFRHKAPFSDTHYQHILAESSTQAIQKH